MPLSTLGTDPDYGSLLGARQDPRLLMAQKLMDVQALPTNNSTQSSFWANLLNQGARGALGGYLYQGVQADREKEATAQATEAAEFNRRLAAGPPGSSSPKGGGDAAPAAPVAPAPQPQASLGGDGGTSEGSAGGGDLVAAVHANESGGRMAPGIMGDGGQAFGPMQVHAGALADVNKALGTNYTLQQLAAEPAIGRKVGAEYARQMQAMFPDPALALAAYQAGPGTVRQAVASGQGLAALTPHTQDYVRRGLAAMRAGQQADATPAPGSNIDALMRGVDQPKPRGIRLAENLLSGTATDSPTPILPDMGDAQGTAAPRIPVAQAALAGAPSGGLLPPRAEPAIVPQPEPAVVPQPDAAVVPAPPDPTPLIPNPRAGYDQGALANFNGLPQPAAAIVPPIAAAVPPRAETPLVPPPDAAVVPTPPAPTPDPAMIAPAGSGETGGQPTIPPPVQGPPIPPGPVRTSRSDALARRLQQAAPAPPAPPAGGGDNATEALNTASLAAARRGENFVPGAPGAGPTGPQLAAPLMSWAGTLSDAGAPLLTPTGGPTGTQLAAPLLPPGAAPGARPNGSFGQASQQGGPVPLLTPASGPGDATTDTRYSKGQTDTTGGQSKGAASSAPAPAASTADAQAKADWYLTMAQKAQSSSNPRIRAQAGMLEAQGQALQRSVDRQTTQADRLTASREAREIAAANRNLPIHEMQGDDGKLHSFQVMPDGTKRDLGLAGNQHEPTAVHTVKLQGDDGKEHMFIVKPDGSKTDLGPTKGEGGADFGNSEEGKARALYISLYPKMADGSAKPEERASFEASRNRLQQVKTIPDGQGGFVRVTPDLPDLAPVWGALPPPSAPDPGQKTDTGQNVAPGTRQYPPPGGRVPPPGEVEKMLAGVNSVRNTGDAMRALRENPSAVGPLTQIFPKLQQWFDPKGVTTQAAVDDIGSELRHARSGGAVTDSEFRYLHNFVPEAGDPYEVAIQKVQRLHRQYGNILQDKYNTYGPNSRYAEIPSVRDAIDEFRYPQVPRGKGGTLDAKMLDDGAAYTLPGGERRKWSAAKQGFVPLQTGY
jgi:hypothetical protein